jgi:hypothetical protein
VRTDVFSFTPTARGGGRYLAMYLSRPAERRIAQ